MASGNVMLPELVWVGDACYRKTPIVYPDAGEEAADADAAVQEYRDEPDCSADADADEVVEVGKGRFKMAFSVPADFRAAVIGKAGATKKAFEAETGTAILIPERGKDGDLVISGASRGAVAAAAARVRLKVAQARKAKSAPASPSLLLSKKEDGQPRPFTHFVSLPLTEPGIQRSFTAFQEAVLGLGPSAPVQPEAFVSPDKLHLTLGMLTIAGPREVEEAKAAFAHVCSASAVSQVLRQAETPLQAVMAARAKVAGLSGGLGFRLRGLEIMNDDPSAVDVLYARVRGPDGKGPPDVLQALGEAVQEVLQFFCQSFSPQQHRRRWGG